MKVLLVSANPEPDNLRLAAEQREIISRTELAERKLQKQLTGPAVPIHFIHSGAVRIQDLVSDLFLHKPQILHFSGHGAQGGILLLETATGGRALVPPDQLVQICAEHRDSLRLVFLNACYSSDVANRLVGPLDAAIGMTETVEDPVALEFAATFYSLLALRVSVGRAFRTARTTAGLVNPGKGSLDSLYLTVRGGLDADALYLDGAAAAATGGASPLAQTPQNNTLVRRALDRDLHDDPHLSAFLMTYYPSIERQMGANMTRIVKINTLLIYERDLSRLMRNLAEYLDSQNDAKAL